MTDPLELPPAFVQLITALRDGAWPHFVLKRNLDGYNEEFDNTLEIMLIDTDPEVVWLSHRCCSHILRETRAHSAADNLLEADGPSAGKPGAIPAVTDFTRLVFFGRNSFGRGGEVSYYCFDYRVSARQPGVICWRHGYWRRVAPDFASFFAL